MDENGKWEWRRRVFAARRAVPAAVREAERAALATALTTALRPETPGTVCAYWPVGNEPGSPELLDGLVHLGCRILLPGASALRDAPQPLY